uniref:Uncharacterized protein n=1 Tax=Klebsiella phage FKP3 TaxID=3231233 RepID=A0AAU8HZX7_9CAUD
MVSPFSFFIFLLLSECQHFLCFMLTKNPVLCYTSLLLVTRSEHALQSN